MISFGLNKDTIAKFKSILANHMSVEKAVLYGSRAKGTYKNSSDIDISLFGSEISLDILLRIETELDNLLLPYHVNLSIYDKVHNDELINHIDKVGKVLYTKV